LNRAFNYDEITNGLKEWASRLNAEDFQIMQDNAI